LLTFTTRTSLLFLIFRYALPVLRSGISAKDGCSMRFAIIHKDERVVKLKF
jgi:hypothetical protein